MLNCERPPEHSDDFRAGCQFDGDGRGAFGPSNSSHRNFAHREISTGINLRLKL